MKRPMRKDRRETERTLLLIALLSCARAVTGNTPELTRVCEFVLPSGRPHQMFITDKRAYVANGTGVVCVDLETFSIAGRFLTSGSARDGAYSQVQLIERADDLAVFAGISVENEEDHPNVRIIALIDFSDPAKPSSLGKHYVEQGPVKTIVGLGRKVLFCTAQHVGMLDFSNPGNVKEVCLLKGRDLSKITAVAGLLLTLEGENIRLWDISRPAEVRELSELSASDVTDLKIQVRERKLILYLVTNGALKLVDITSPQNPIDLGVTDLPPSRGAARVNVKYPDNPAVTGEFVSAVPRRLDFAAAGNHAYVLSSDGLYDFEVADTSNPKQQGFLPLQGNVLTVGAAIKNGVCYIACNADTGFYEGRVYKIKFESGKQRLLKTADAFDHITGIYAGPKHVYVVSGADVTILDDDLSTLGTFSVRGEIMDLAEKDNLLYLSSCPVVLHILDISDPAKILPIGTYVDPQTTCSRARNLQLKNNRIYQAEGSGRVLEINVSKPSQPELVREYDVKVADRNVQIIGIQLDGSRMYVLGELPRQGSIVSAFDMQEAGLDLLSWYPLANARAFQFDGERVFVAEGDNGVKALQWQNDTFLPLGKYEAPGALFEQVLVQGDNVYAVNAESVLLLNRQDGKYPRKPSRITANPAAFTVSPKGRKCQLLKKDKTPIRPEEVADAYGREFTILADGLDVCSGEYAELIGNQHCRRPVFQDLSDAAGWPNIKVVADTVAIDPRLGRFKFAEGDENPVRLVGGCDLPQGFVNGILIDGNVAYVANGESGVAGICSIDISDPHNPRVLHRCNGGDVSLRVVKEGKYLYSASIYRITVVDVSDPCKLKPTFCPPTPGHAMDMVILNKYAYVCTDAGLQIYTLEDPINPVNTAKQYVPNKNILTSCIHLENNRLYLAYDEEESKTGVLDILDLTDPGSPKSIGKYRTDMTIRKITVNNSIAYLYGRNYEGFEIVDVSDPADCKRLSRNRVCIPVEDYDPTSGGSGEYRFCDSGGVMCVSGGRLYITGWVMAILDISDPQKVKILGYAKGRGGEVHDVKVIGNLAYVADYGYGLTIFDVSDPANPRDIGGCETAGWGGRIVVEGDYAYTDCIGGSQNGLRIINIADKRNPFLASSIRREFRGGTGTCVDNDLLYFCGRGFLVCDIKSPPQVNILGQCKGGGTHKITIKNGFAYHPQRHGKGFGIIDVRDPRGPVFKRLFELEDKRFFCVSASGNYAYFGVGDQASTEDNGFEGKGGVHIFDISNPEEPILKGKWERNFATVRIASRENYIFAFEGGREGYMYVLDAKDPENPISISKCLVSSQRAPLGDIAIAGDYLFQASYWDGVVDVIDIHDVKNPRLIDKFKSGRPYYHLGGIDVLNGYGYITTPYSLEIIDVPTSSEVPQGSIVFRGFYIPLPK